MMVMKVIFVMILVRVECVPNIVMMIVDDMGWGDVGYNSEMPKTVSTPTIDTLANEGIKFPHFYTSPTCTASRAALMTGKYPMHLGLQDSVIHPSEPRGVPLNEKFLSEKLKERAGYRTVFIGKWHLGFAQKAYAPTRRGFEEFYGILTGGGDHFEHSSTETVAMRGPEYKQRATVMTGYNLWHNDVPVPLEEHQGVHTTTLYTRKTVEYINQMFPSGLPVFLVLAYQAIHAPIQGSPKARQCPTAATGKRRAMCQMIASVDESVETIENALQPFWNNTVLFFLSDNGGILRHGSSNGVLRGEKGSYYEGGIRVPAFISGGFLLPQSRNTKKLASYPGLIHITDLHTTALALADCYFPKTDDVDLDGVDHLTSLKNNKKQDDIFPRNHVAHNINSELFGSAGALRVGDYKLIVQARVSESEIYEYGQHMLQDDNWDEAELDQVIHQKLLRSPGESSLFNIVLNPTETDDPEHCDESEKCRDLYSLQDFQQIKDSMLTKWEELRQITPRSTELWQDDGPLADPANFGGIWTPWRDDMGYPYATYQLAEKSAHPNLAGDSAPRPALTQSVSTTNIDQHRRLSSSSSSPPPTATTTLGCAVQGSLFQRHHIALLFLAYFLGYYFGTQHHVSSSTNRHLTSNSGTKTPIATA
uniref:Sulfatase N-terminal domain-containing protein n=1 Tax=Aureoumbra lagunensis TaxID=44058 RepID=A0A7S3JYB2_9STRA|mmetsp:Transcript_9618/g.14744  ORF Transcript_9618/g.14744 Transcript_9618/m.14744 type:complete len:648 (-) Transcript_9618:422-2365(-)